MDPIYLREGRLTPRSDTYSFGSVLLELIARKRVKQGEINLIVAFSKACEKGKGRKDLFDAEIANENNIKILEELGKLATECLTMDIGKRPHMSDVAERLLMLRKFQKAGDENTSWRFLWGVQISWPRKYKHDTSLSSSSSLEQVRKSFGIFKRNSGNFDILKELGNVRIFTMAELDEATQNYSCLIGESLSSEVYKGALEDNTKVTVKKYIGKVDDLKEEFINGGMILSQIVHKNIIKLLGCCMDAYSPIFVYEYAAKGSLSNILNGMDQFLPDLRLKIAVKIAEALEYLHSTATGIIGHGYIVPAKILLDDNFMPKLSGFSWARRLNMENKIPVGDTVVSGCFPQNMTCDDQPVVLKVKTDVYQFGVLLLVLISRKNYKFYEDHHHLIFEFVTAYKNDSRGRAFFDADITAEEDITVLEAMGMLALRCTCSELDDRPTMKEVAEHLRMIRRSWKRTCNIFRC
ncbi:hypothetical protein QOZ80_9AG0685530 [Eleusine coracana subsp. coracana]|nr:hypothetical protein QOZ80_9AG0685530 [Eleusine coracana subsp. coracana]